MPFSLGACPSFFKAFSGLAKRCAFAQFRLEWAGGAQKGLEWTTDRGVGAQKGLEWTTGSAKWPRVDDWRIHSTVICAPGNPLDRILRSEGAEANPLDGVLRSEPAGTNPRERVCAMLHSLKIPKAPFSLYAEGWLDVFAHWVSPCVWDLRALGIAVTGLDALHAL